MMIQNALAWEPLSENRQKSSSLNQASLCKFLKLRNFPQTPPRILLAPSLRAAGKCSRLSLNTPSTAANPAFDVTPAWLITGLITERGICEADESAIAKKFPST